MDELERLTGRVMEDRAGCRDPQVRLRACELCSCTLANGCRSSRKCRWQVDSVAGRRADGWIEFRLADVVMPKAGEDPLAPRSPRHPAQRRIRVLPAATLRSGANVVVRAAATGPLRAASASSRDGSAAAGSPARWQGKARPGQFSEVDFESLLADYSPQRLGGPANWCGNLADPRRAAGDGQPAGSTPGRARWQPIAVGCRRPAAGLAAGSEAGNSSPALSSNWPGLHLSEQGTAVQGRCPVGGTAGRDPGRSFRTDAG